MSDDAVQVEFLHSLSEISAQEWNALCDTDYPFLRHDFLLGLEQTGCTTADTGWQPCHALLRRNDRLVALLPTYLKSHSWGEYVFDWSWADAYQRIGLRYYPRLVSAIPFTPATGPRLCTASGENRERAAAALVAGIQAFSQRNELSGWHVLFPNDSDAGVFESLDLTKRRACQFHWFNEGYTDFDSFLSRFNSRKRKALRRERRRVAEQGITLRRLRGDDITPADWERFHHFYQITYAKRSGHGGYLSREFFTDTAAHLGQQVMMAVAEREGRDIAAALFFCSGDTLFGRYWGCEQEFDCLHFEACYYQGIEFCIEEGLKRFDPGAQGEHKIQRGFQPVETVSYHWLADERFAAAIRDFTEEEATHNRRYQQQAAELLPFRLSD